MPKEELTNKRSEKIRCPHCNSSFNYYKSREEVWQCRSCGETFSKEEAIEDANN